MTSRQSFGGNLPSPTIKQNKEKGFEKSEEQRRRNYCRIFINKVNYGLEAAFAKYVFTLSYIYSLYIKRI